MPHRRAAFPPPVERAVRRVEGGHPLLAEFVARAQVDAVAVPLHRVRGPRRPPRAQFERAGQDEPRPEEVAGPLRDAVGGHRLHAVHHPVNQRLARKQGLDTQLAPVFLRAFRGARDEDEVAAGGPNRVRQRLGHRNLRVDRGAAHVCADAPARQAEVEQGVLAFELPRISVAAVLLGPAEPTDPVEVRAVAHLRFSAGEPERERVDPELAFKGQFAFAARHEGQMKTRTVRDGQGVDDVVAVVRGGAVVERRGEGAVEDEKPVVVEVDVREPRVELGHVLAAVEAAEPCGFVGRLGPVRAETLAHRADGFGHDEGQGGPDFRAVHVVEDPRKRPPVPPLHLLAAQVVEVDFDARARPVGYGACGLRAVALFRLDDPVHQGPGRVFGVLVRADHGGAEFDGLGFEGDVEGLGDAAADFEGPGTVAHEADLQHAWAVWGAGAEGPVQRGHRARDGGIAREKHRDIRHGGAGGAVEHTAGHGRGLASRREGREEGKEQKEREAQVHGGRDARVRPKVTACARALR